MFKMPRFTLLLLFICCFSTVFAQQRVKNDSLLNFIQIKDENLREQKLVTYIKTNFQDLPLDGLRLEKDSLIGLISNSKIYNSDALILLAESIYEKRLLRFSEAKKLMLSAVEKVQKKSNHFLLYTFFSQLAFIQTDEGDAIDAVYSYELAKGEVKKLNDPYLEAILYVNISDIYYRIGLYSQSLFYLDKAQDLSSKHQLHQVNFLRLVNYNKAENYFRTNNYDSLSFYHKNLLALKGQSNKLYTSQKRTGYYLLLLKHDYKAAILNINLLLKDSSYVKDDIDEQHLASSYFFNKQIDSAGYVINDLLQRPMLINHPEIKFQLYEMLGEIAQIKNDNKQAALNFKLSLQQSKQNINNLTQVGNVASQMKISDVQSLYYENMLTYKKEQLKLRFIVAVAFLIVIIIAISYRTTRQKRHYEKLLHTARMHELANINSHEVRNHLSNILGLLDLMNDEDNEGSELYRTKHYLHYSAEQLDKALKNVSKKLSN
ncbi:hypothetical protein [Mucilaginibacter aquaedulcis]|uniref:hypothetical protein n=1 Tax=Mucilaginibacter aquaedulcis TaxID=1187081 RepID=UPI0025B3B218|nr:hypothetical protein [Mucilaginibacter aquaedulcis]MDN3549056.1 hypothetical protein [Mucilaginibacter aquaedulcis]